MIPRARTSKVTLAALGLLGLSALSTSVASAARPIGAGTLLETTTPTGTGTMTATATGSMTATASATATGSTTATASPTGSATASATPLGGGANGTATATGTATSGTETQAPTLSTPSDASTLTAFNTTLTWTNPTDATQVEVWVVPFNNDGPAAHLYLGSAASTLTIPGPPTWYGLLPDMTYRWRVRVGNATVALDTTSTAWGPWAERSFRTPAATSEGIAAMSPSNNGVSATLNPTLQWSNTSSSVFYYEVQLSSDPAFNTNASTAMAPVYWNIVHGGVSTPANSWTVPSSASLMGNTTYYWRVRPRVQGDGMPAAWSSAWSFTTSASAMPGTPMPTMSPSATGTMTPTVTSGSTTPTATATMGSMTPTATGTANGTGTATTTPTMTATAGTATTTPTMTATSTLGTATATITPLSVGSPTATP